MRSQPLSKLNVLGLSTRKWTKLFMIMLHGCVEGSCISYSMTICSRVWISASPHGQLIGRWGKNLCRYSPMGAWAVVMWVKQAHSKLVKLIEGSHEPSLVYVSLMTFWFSSSKSRKHWPLLGLDMKDSCHSWRMLSHSFFLLNRCNSLLGKMGAQLLALTWLSMSLCLGYLALLGQNQNWILFLLSFLKKKSIADVTRINMFWRGSVLDSKIFFAAAIESVMTMMLWTFSSSIAGIRPKRIAISLVSIDVMFIELTCKCRTIELSV